MTLRTGKTGRYRYYTCSTCARQGKSSCEGRSIPMDKLDRFVTDRFADRLLTPERVGDLLAGLMERQSAKNEDHATRLTALRAKISDVENRLGRLYAAIETGLADLNDQTLKDRVVAVKTERDLAQSRTIAPSWKQTRARASRTRRSRNSSRRCAQMS